jgi:peroxiredoxin
MNEQFVQKGAQVLVILGDSLERAKSYAESLKSPFPVLSDPEREVYHRYELEKSLIGIQHTAEVIVDGEGVIRYMKRALNPMTWLQDSRELLEEV